MQQAVLYFFLICYIFLDHFSLVLKIKTGPWSQIKNIIETAGPKIYDGEIPRPKSHDLEERRQ